MRLVEARKKIAAVGITFDGVWGTNLEVSVR